MASVKGMVGMFTEVGSSIVFASSFIRSSLSKTTRSFHPPFSSFLPSRPHPGPEIHVDVEIGWLRECSSVNQAAVPLLLLRW